ncbi:YcdB/YcdC domain-containing protein [Calorimonas adulescens]|uniref:Uncharacterized protein n=1 Tax=Calorimonas adulescens TaxID=2606906 RepID=A0A5D8QAU4_9THEO|nr:YcdB/YcdC domain-containing protein [Calorimonas adulescens]TZE81720.1 hypothetical protein FWJ32_08265 [Calorimonas adulescens]
MRFKTFITVLLVCILVYGHAYAEGPNFILKGKNVLEDGIIYYLQRIYNGIPVYDEGVYLTIDRNGELIYLSDSFGDGDFAESKNIVSLQDALGNIHDSVLKSWYIKEKDGYVRVLKPTEFVVDASTGKVIDLEDEGYEIEGNSALDWGDTDMTLNKMEALLEQDGYTYTQKTYSEFNGSRNTNYITGNKKFSYLNIAIADNKVISIMFSSLHSDGTDRTVDAKSVRTVADKIFKEIVLKGNKAIGHMNETEKGYRFNYVRMENGIEVEDNGLEIVMSKDGYIESLKYRWDAASFNDTGCFDMEEILKRYIEAAEFNLYYRKLGNRYIPVYAASKRIEYITSQGSVVYNPVF